MIEFGQRGNIKELVKYVQEFLIYCSVRDKENFTEKENLKKYVIIFEGFEKYYLEEIV